MSVVREMLERAQRIEAKADKLQFGMKLRIEQLEKRLREVTADRDHGNVLLQEAGELLRVMTTRHNDLMAVVEHMQSRQDSGASQL